MSIYSRRLAERARALVASLVSSQAADGSWTSDVIGGYTTARVFWALIAARNAGIAVHKDSLEKAAAFLLKQLESFDANDNDSKAIVLHALSTDKRADFAACNRLYRDRNALGAATLAYLTRAFFNIDRKEIAAELAAILEGKAKVEPDHPIVWESGYKAAWLNDAPETTAPCAVSPGGIQTGLATRRCRRPIVVAIPRLFRLPHRPRQRPGRGRPGHLVRPRQGTSHRHGNHRAGQRQGSGRRESRRPSRASRC